MRRLALALLLTLPRLALGASPVNPQFDSAVTATSAADDTWWKVTSAPSGGSATVTAPYANAYMTGANAARLYVNAPGTPSNGSAQLNYRFLKAELDASGAVTFDWRTANNINIAAGDLTTYQQVFYLAIGAYDASSASVLDGTNGRGYILIAGASFPGSSFVNQDSTTLWSGSAITGHVYTASFDLKAWISARMVSGKTWADVSYVHMFMRAQTGIYDSNATVPLSPVDILIDNFRAPLAATVVASPGAGTYTSAQSVTLSCTSPSPTIRYTLDGSTPTGSSTVYSSPLSVSASETVKAICQSSGMTDSAVGSWAYTIQAAAPTASPAAGTYTSAQTVTLTTALGGVICYTTDGSTPATNGTTGCTTGTLYSSAVPVAANLTMKAIAGGTGFTDGSVASFAYVINYAPTVTAVTPNHCTTRGACSVTITGTNFRSGAAATFGGTACTSLTVVSPTSITCTVPAHAAGHVDVTVSE